jgi:hypothetical protein
MPLLRHSTPPDAEGDFRPDRIELALLILFAVLPFVLIFSGAGGAARIVFLVGAGLLGIVLCLRNPPLYIRFTLWLWFLTPFVRRLLDYRTGWVDTDPILGASLLASYACLLHVYRYLFRGDARRGLPFLFGFGAVGYGFCAGIIGTQFQSVVLEAANWFGPMLFGFFVFLEYGTERKRKDVAAAFESTFRWGLLIMGAYGIIQFISVPAWDALWLTQVDNRAFGTAEPFGLRVFSTMASPVPFGVASFAGLILLRRQSGGISLLATLGGYASLAFSSVRSTWGLWLIATVLVLVLQRQKLGRFLLIIGVSLSLLVLSTTIQPVRDVLQKRFETLSDLRNDGSLLDRTSGYEQMTSYVLSNPLGLGLAATENLVGGRSDLGGRDSGVLEIVLALGWIGGGIYFSALLLIVWSGLKGRNGRNDFEISACAISIAMVSHMILASISSGFSAAVLWSFAGVNLASQTHRVVNRRASLAAKLSLT